MKEKAKQIAEQVKQRWQSTSKKIKLLLGGCVVAAAVVAVVIALVMANRPYTELFTGLSQSDQTAILTYFSDNGITDYRVEDDAILVPENQKASLMAKVLVAGYPSSGYDYGTYMDHVGSLTTESERNQLVLYDLQDYMAAVICNMDGVEKASVLLTPGEDNTYVLDSGDQVDASAAVQVTMEDGKTLRENEVKAIRNLVSHGLSGLNVENVEISDTYGNTYSTDADFSDVQDASQLKLDLEEKYNNLIRTRVMQVLLPLYGEDNVRVSVNTVVDLDRSYTDSTDYSLEPWAQGKDDGIIGTQIWDDSIVRDDGTTTGGVAGTQSNADLNTYALIYLKNIDVQMRRELAHQDAARRDPLTRVYNRNIFRSEVEEYMSDSDRNRKGVLILLDVDNFKRINDRFGHLEGDKALKRVTDLLKSVFRSGDLIGRLGGDEFMVFIKGSIQQEVLENRVQSFLAALQKDEKEPITCSAGITFVHAEGFSFEESICQADMALYKSKQMGKNHFCYSESACT